jgi:small multidrug resistance pump
VFEVAGTLTLKFTEGMTRLWPMVLMFVFYLASLFGLSVAVCKIQSLPPTRSGWAWGR